MLDVGVEVCHVYDVDNPPPKSTGKRKKGAGKRPGKRAKITDELSMSGPEVVSEDEDPEGDWLPKVEPKSEVVPGRKRKRQRKDEDDDPGRARSMTADCSSTLTRERKRETKDEDGDPERARSMTADFPSTPTPATRRYLGKNRAEVVLTSPRKKPRHS